VHGDPKKKILLGVDEDEHQVWRVDPGAWSEDKAPWLPEESSTWTRSGEATGPSRKVETLTKGRSSGDVMKACFQ
jgi:hypothetical protein